MRDERLANTGVPRVPRLALAKPRVTLKARTGGMMPTYLGSTLRGTFGHVFKQIGCALETGCRGECQARAHCAYSYLFETPIPEELRGRLGNQFASHPFVLCPLDHTEGHVVRGQPIAFSVTLFGRGISYYPHLLAAFEELGKRGLGAERVPFSVDSVTDSLHPDGRLVFDPVEHRVLGSPIIRDLRSLAEGVTREITEDEEGQFDVRVRYLSPTHLVRDGETLREPDIDAMLAGLHRRLEALTLLHGEGPGAWDNRLASETPDPSSLSWERARVRLPRVLHPGSDDAVAVLPWDWDVSRGMRVGNSAVLREIAADVGSETSRLDWVIWDRLSNRQKRHIPMYGAMGDAIYRGVPVECLPWLIAGQWLHVGKATAFGMGRYVMEVLGRSQ